MQPATVVLPPVGGVPGSGFPHSTSFSGPFSPPLGGGNPLSSVPHALVQIPRRNSVMSANDEIPTSRFGDPFGKFESTYILNSIEIRILRNLINCYLN